MKPKIAPQAPAAGLGRRVAPLATAAALLWLLPLAVQAQTHGPPAPHPAPGEVAALDSVIAQAAGVAQESTAKAVAVTSGANGGLLDAFVRHMAVVDLQNLGLRADRCPAPLNGGRDGPPAELPGPIIRYLLNRGDDGLVHVETEARKGQLRLIVAVYTAGSGDLRTRAALPFRVPEDLSSLLTAEPQRLSAADAKWLMALGEAFGPTGRDVDPSVDASEAEFFFQEGLWRDAAPRLERIAARGDSHALLKAVFAYQQAGEWEEAMALVAAALKKKPDSGPLWALRSWLSLRRGRTEDAVLYLEEARIWGMAREGIYRFARGLMAVEQDDAETAERELIRAAELLADREFAPLEVARFYRDRAQMDKAIAYYRKATKAADPSAETWGELAVALEAGGDVKGAADALREAVSIRNDNVMLTRHLASLLRQMGRPDEALAVLKRAATANPLNAAMLAAYGDCAVSLWKLDVATDAFGEAVEAVGDSPYGEVRLAAVMRMRRQYREARAALTSLIAREPDYCPARIELGRVLCEIGRFDDAISTLEVAAARPGYEVQARLVLVDVYLAAERPQDAVAAGQIAAAARPDDVTFAKLAEAFAAAGDLGKAETAARTALEKDPSSPVAMVALGRVLLARGSVDEAEDLSDKAVAADSYYVPALRLAGSVHKARGDYQQCAELWRRAVTLDQWNADIHRELSDLLGPKLNDWTATEEHLKKYVELEKLRAEASI